MSALSECIDILFRIVLDQEKTGDREAWNRLTSGFQADGVEGREKIDFPRFLIHLKVSLPYPDET